MADTNRISSEENRTVPEARRGDSSLKLITLHAGVVALLSVAVGLYNSMHHSMVFAMGGLAGLVSLTLMAGSFRLILQKKLIARGLSLIVIKYTILGVIIYRVLQEPGSMLPWFFAGLATLVLSGLASTWVRPRADLAG